MKKKFSIPVIYEDDFLFAVNKPPRVISVPGPGIFLEKTVLGIVQRQFEGCDFRPYILHRLDAETSGVLLFGKHERDRKPLEAIFRDPQTQKVYVALLLGVPRGNVLRLKLPARHGAEHIFSETHFRVLHVFRVLGKSCAFVECVIKTGRKHQIRQHFGQIGCPVLMDREYGDFQFNRKFVQTFHLDRQFLHAARMAFSHPFLHRRVEIEAKLWPDLLACVKKMAR